MISHNSENNMKDEIENFMVAKSSTNKSLSTSRPAGSPEPRPFLKRGSRKEPSALNRLNNKLSDMNQQQLKETTSTRIDSHMTTDNNVSMHVKNFTSPRQLAPAPVPVPVSASRLSLSRDNGLDGTSTITNLFDYEEFQNQQYSHKRTQLMQDLQEFEELEQFVDSSATATSATTAPASLPISNSVVVDDDNNGDDDSFSPLTTKTAVRNSNNFENNILSKDSGTNSSKNTTNSAATLARGASGDMVATLHSNRYGNDYNDEFVAVADDELEESLPSATISHRFHDDNYNNVTTSSNYEQNHNQHSYNDIGDNDDYGRDNLMKTTGQLKHHQTYSSNDSEDDYDNNEFNSPSNTSTSLNSQTAVIGSNSGQMSNSHRLEASPPSGRNRHTYSQQVQDEWEAAGRNQQSKNLHQRQNQSPSPSPSYVRTSSVIVGRNANGTPIVEQRPVSAARSSSGVAAAGVRTGASNPGTPRTSSSRSNTPSSSSRPASGRKPTPTNRRSSNNSSSSGYGRNNNNSLNNSQQSHSSSGSNSGSAVIEDADINQQAKELATLLQQYQADTAALAASKQQQHAMLNDIKTQKEEVYKWIAAEKVKCKAECDALRDSAKREKRNLLSDVKELKQNLLLQQEVGDLNSGSGDVSNSTRSASISGSNSTQLTAGSMNVLNSIKQYKAELAGCYATIEKLKVDLGQASKKNKSAEARWQQMLKDAQAQTHALTERVATITGEQEELFRYLKEARVQLPKRFYLSSGAASVGVSSSNTTAKKNGSSNTHTRGSVQLASSSTATVTAAGRRTVGAAGRSHVESIPVVDSFRRTPATSTTVYDSDDAGDGHQQDDVYSDNDDYGYLEHREEDHKQEQAQEQEQQQDQEYEQDRNSRSFHNDTNNTSLSQLLFDKSSKRHIGSSTTTASPVVAATTSSSTNESCTTHSLKNMNLVKSTSSHSKSPVTTPRASSVPIPTSTSSGVPKVTTYRNGTIKEIYQNGDIIIRFTNDDVKCTVAADGSVVYYYAEAQTTHTAYTNGEEKYAFANGQVEKHYRDGSKHVLFPNGTEKHIYPDGLEESVVPI